MKFKDEIKPLTWIVGLFIAAYFLPLSSPRFEAAIFDAFKLVQWYAREHVILCLIPAFFIAGAIAVFMSQNAILKYFGAEAKKWLAYAVASVSGSILAVCSCTILPLFAGIYKRGAGLGPAITFLYSGPAVNVLAIILTARILGVELGIARIFGAVVFAVVIGLIMHVVYLKEEKSRIDTIQPPPDIESSQDLWKAGFNLAVMILILVFANWGKTGASDGFWAEMYTHKWMITAILGGFFVLSLILLLKVNRYFVLTAASLVVFTAILWPNRPLIPFTAAIIMLTIILAFSGGESKQWLFESWRFTKQIMPLLAMGVLAAGFLLGSVNNGAGIIPETWIHSMVGGNGIMANLFASVVGAFMYFATLTEIPILQGLLNSGMGKGPALALLLAGPAVSLPNMLVIRSVVGTQKTIVYIILVIIMATISGLVYGHFF